MAASELYHLGRLRALRGGALVTYPYGSTSYRRVERVLSIEREQQETTFLTTDGEFTGTKLVDQRITGGDHLYAEVYQRFDTIPGPILTSKVYDPLTKQLITESRQMVAASEADPTLGNRLQGFSSIPNNLLTKQHVIREYPSALIGTSIIDYQADTYRYPAILHSIGTSTATKLDGSVLAMVTPVIEAERPKQIAKRITRTFSETAPDSASIISGIYAIERIRHAYNGVFFSVLTGPVLSDAVSLNFSASDDPTWGAISETYTKAASVPTASAYIASRSAGQWKTIYRDVKTLAKSLYMTIDVDIPIL